MNKSKTICMYCRQEVVDNKCGCSIRYIETFNTHGVDILPHIEGDDFNK